MGNLLIVSLDGCLLFPILESLSLLVKTFGECWPKSHFYSVQKLKEHTCEWHVLYWLGVVSFYMLGVFVVFLGLCFFLCFCKCN